MPGKRALSSSLGALTKRKKVINASSSSVATVKVENTENGNGLQLEQIQTSCGTNEFNGAFKESIDSPKVKIEVESESRPNIFPKIDPVDSVKGPPGWAQIYNEIVEMRSKFLAPVDSQGCESMPNTITPGLKHSDPKKYRFQLLISLMLSSQTKDEVNYEAMVRLDNGLRKSHSGGFCLEAMSQLSVSEIDSYICKVGFHNRKAQYIAKTCQILKSEFNGDIPNSIEDIVKLPGVGPKMGYLLLQAGWGINSGIGVDVHLHRLALLWRWVSTKATTPEKCRLELESWLPPKYWRDVNPLVVGFGQVICVPRASNCDICAIGRKGLCPGANKKLLKGPVSEERKIKLMKQRGDLTALINQYL
ncbi:NTH1 [Candida theae]|uniref:Endonuclease III homolog n=1 Tax=Candida theae TaxID=1198502 RepID=A0AAD5FYA3_9ASCO|nr:NTH1 [Candida theae]KAI5957974.1 NTH1 [Candida theae]